MEEDFIANCLRQGFGASFSIRIAMQFFVFLAAGRGIMTVNVMRL